MCCLRWLRAVLGRMVLHGTWCSASGWELRGAGSGAAGPDPALPSSGGHAVAHVQEDLEPSLGTLGAPRAGVGYPMAGGGVPQQGTMPQGTDAACRGMSLPLAGRGRSLGWLQQNAAMPTSCCLSMAERGQEGSPALSLPHCCR